MKEEEPISASIINLLGDSILRSLVSDLKRSFPVISWQKFVKLDLRVGSYGLNLINIPAEVRSFLEELIKVRMSNDPKQREEFLKKTRNLSDEFFDQPLGKFEDPNIIPVTLSQLNLAIIKMLQRGVKFDFNGQKEKNE